METSTYSFKVSLMHTIQYKQPHTKTGDWISMMGDLGFLSWPVWWEYTNLTNPHLRCEWHYMHITDNGPITTTVTWTAEITSHWISNIRAIVSDQGTHLIPRAVYDVIRVAVGQILFDTEDYVCRFGAAVQVWPYNSYGGLVSSSSIEAETQCCLFRSPAGIKKDRGIQSLTLSPAAVNTWNRIYLKKTLVFWWLGNEDETAIPKIKIWSLGIRKSLAYNVVFRCYLWQNMIYM